MLKRRRIENITPIRKKIQKKDKIYKNKRKFEDIFL